ncbi:hypothetical protein GLE_4793 [Lysobacter enzymogenes]|uniref:Uncharacterized protein n=1 Tax=Lysobacter enzymogenes TaxID=69 RepID=A0A0S2DNC6_LYSEN|nr:hypothetical protein GLE_4793 [Lysobacter enzymogenes]
MRCRGRGSRRSYSRIRNPSPVIPAKAGTHVDVAAAFAVTDVSRDDKPPSKAFVRKRPSYFLLSARQKKVAKEKRLFKVTSH